MLFTGFWQAHWTTKTTTNHFLASFQWIITMMKRLKKNTLSNENIPVSKNIRPPQTYQCQSLQIMWSVLSCDVTIYIDTIDTGLKIVLDSDGDNDTADDMEHETWNILRDNYSLSPLTWWETLLSTNTSKEYILWSVHVLNISDLGTTSKYTTIDCHAAFHLPTVNTLHLVICGWNLDNYGVIDFILYLHPYNYLSMFQICAL